MKSDFSIGDRVQMSALGAARCPRRADKTGTIVGRSIYVNCARVLLDEKQVTNLRSLRLS